VVGDVAALEERVRFVHTKLHADALVEKYIEGRELYVGILGNARPETLPVWELELSQLPSPASRIATRRAKWDRDYRRRHRIVSREARELAEPLARAAHDIARTAYRLLGLTGYARIDLRLAPDGQLYLLEANPNPHIGTDEDFARSADRAGVSYPELVARILRLGMRWRPTG
jgi:D-alanine-D-alanine ligase